MHCYISLSDQRATEELRDTLSMEDVSIVMRQMRFKWFGHPERIRG